VALSTAQPNPPPPAPRHPNIVNLLDIFEVDANTFATVLELCPGGDLDTHLKEHTVGAACPPALALAMRAGTCPQPAPERPRVASCSTAHTTPPSPQPSPDSAHTPSHHRQTLPEREARAIMAQVFAGLAYLNRGSSGGPTYPAGLGDGGDGGGGPGQSLPRVIHYDLKP
jgi:serine/threonine protein kinase